MRVLSRPVRGVLLALSLALAAGGVALAETGSSPDNVVVAKNDAPPTTAAPETTTTSAPPTTTSTTIARTTTSTLHVTSTTTSPVPTTRHTLPIPTTPCSWAIDVWPKLENSPTPMLYVHLTAPSLPNTGVTVGVYPRGGPTALFSKSGRTDGSGRVDIPFALADHQVGMQVDLGGSMVIGGLMGHCDPDRIPVSLGTA